MHSFSLAEKMSGAGSKRSPPASGDDSSQHAISDSKRSRKHAVEDEDSRHDSDASSNHGRSFFMSKSLDTDDPVRLKAREMIQGALETSRKYTHFLNDNSFIKLQLLLFIILQK